MIVSEETGAISIAEAGHIDYDYPRDQFERILGERFEVTLTAVPRTHEPAEANESIEHAILSDNNRQDAAA